MKLVVFEGIDGSGKSTQVQLLFNYLKRKKIDVEKIDFPRYGCFFGKVIKIILHQKWGKKVSPYFVAWLFAVDRCLAKSMINKWLNQGKTVLIDRYTASSMAHQGAKLTGVEQQKLIDWIKNLEEKIFKLPVPDKVFFIDLPAEAAEKLISKRARKKDEAERDFNYQQKTYALYQKLAKANYWTIIKCVDKKGEILSAQKIHEEIRTRIN